LKVRNLYFLVWQLDSSIAVERQMLVTNFIVMNLNRTFIKNNKLFCSW